MKHRFFRPGSFCLAFFLILCSAFSPFFSFPAEAATKAEIDTLTAHFPESWPEPPEIASEAAILIECSSGTIVYAKNATRSMYPASTTKLMTALLTLKNCSLDEIVTYSSTAVLSLETGSSHIGLKVGESLNVEDSLYGLLLPSANEVANGLAEHISGSISAFVDLMNETAASLGCVNTHFANANGLHNPDHMSCAYDLALIMAACIQQSDFVRIASASAYDRQPDELLDKEIPMGTTNQFLKKDSEYYDPAVICGKTGWTEEAGRCLVTYSKEGDLDLICVVMNSEAPNQYNDTELLINYAARNFALVRPSDADPKLSTSNLNFQSPLGLTAENFRLPGLDESARILLPDNCTFSDLYRKTETSEDGTVSITYKLDGYPLGSVSLVSTSSDTSVDTFWNSSVSSSILDHVKTGNLISISIWLIFALILFVILAVIAAVLFLKVRSDRETVSDESKEHRIHLQ